MNWLIIAIFIILVLVVILQQSQIFKLRNYVHELDHIILRIIVAADIEQQMGIASEVIE